jgi:hypothetical protein
VSDDATFTTLMQNLHDSDSHESIASALPLGGKSLLQEQCMRSILKCKIHLFSIFCITPILVRVNAGFSGRINEIRHVCKKIQARSMPI